MNSRIRPKVGYIDRHTVAVVNDREELMSPKAARSLGLDLIDAAQKAQMMTPREIMDGFDEERRKLREEFPEIADAAREFLDQEAAEGTPCTCPMSIRERGEHALHCPARVAS